ncbi:MAG: hypothetical protein IPL46_07390 [Saprospiraceae bacterium]|nr:hypothetical protein [Saprospiraceae bacterium]
MVRLFTFAFLLSLTASSCADRSEVVLTRDDLKLADSLFLVSRNEWNANLKDSCNLFRDDMLSIWTDSIRERRLSEIKLMLEQYEKSK